MVATTKYTIIDSIKENNITTLNYNSDIQLGRHYYGRPPPSKYWGDMSPRPIGIDAPAHTHKQN